MKAGRVIARLFLSSCYKLNSHWVTSALLHTAGSPSVHADLLAGAYGFVVSIVMRRLDRPAPKYAHATKFWALAMAASSKWSVARSTSSSYFETSPFHVFPAVVAVYMVPSSELPVCLMSLAAGQTTFAAAASQQARRRAATPITRFRFLVMIDSLLCVSDVDGRTISRSGQIQPVGR